MNLLYLAAAAASLNIIEQPYELILNANCPRISANCIFTSVSSFKELVQQCSETCRVEYEQAIQCNDPAIAQLLIRMYNAKCVAVDGELCWLNTTTNTNTSDTTNGTFNCTSCNKKLMEKEDSLARYLETKFNIKRRQVYFMKYHRVIATNACGPSFIEYGIEADQVLEGQTSTTGIPLYAIIIVSIGALTSIALVYYLYKRRISKKEFEYADDSLYTTDDAHSSVSKLKELHITPNLNRLSQQFTPSPTSPVHAGDVSFIDPPASRFSTFSIKD